MLKPKIHPIRTLILLAISGALTYTIADELFNVPLPFIVLLVGLAVSPLIATFGSPAMQFAVRGGWFAGLCWSVLGTYMTIDNSKWAEPVMWGLGFAAMIAVGGFQTLRRTGSAAPARFRKTLTTSLVFGLADFTTLAFIACLIAYDGPRYQWLVLTFTGTSAFLMGIALLGLYRMKVWGLFLCLTMNIVVVIWLFSGVLDFPEELAVMLTTTAVIQLMLPIPIFVAIRNTRKLSSAS